MDPADQFQQTFRMEAANGFSLGPDQLWFPPEVIGPSFAP